MNRIWLEDIMTQYSHEVSIKNKNNQSGNEKNRNTDFAFRTVIVTIE
jgi:hypothetical protein